VPDGLMSHGGTTMPDPKVLGQTRRHFPRIAAIISILDRQHRNNRFVSRGISCFAIGPKSGVIIRAILVEFGMTGSDSCKEWIPPNRNPLVRLYIHSQCRSPATGESLD
jgi:hypothetical protein